jgi:AraC-like DNA-binding protein
LGHCLSLCGPKAQGQTARRVHRRLAPARFARRDYGANTAYAHVRESRRRPEILIRGSLGISQRETLSSIGPALDVDPKREACESASSAKPVRRHEEDDRFAAARGVVEFNSSSHFSNLFRAQFGVRPPDVRGTSA